MNYGIVTLPLAPVRAESDERSEMTSQLLFGEIVEIIEYNDKWLYIRNLSDNYKGYIDRKMLQFLKNFEYEELLQMRTAQVNVPIATIYNSNNQAIKIPFGSNIYLDDDNRCVVAGEKYIYEPYEICEIVQQTGNEVVKAAKQFLNAPYLWGGKSIFGVDCSGLAQLCYKHIEVQLPRDAAEQVNCGTAINSFSDICEGDLAFFENEKNKIVHVGILLNKNQIIHSSGWVKIENFDKKGIISSTSGDYTHKLKCIKRYC